MAIAKRQHPRKTGDLLTSKQYNSSLEYGIMNYHKQNNHAPQKGVIHI